MIHSVILLISYLMSIIEVYGNENKCIRREKRVLFLSVVCLVSQLCTHDRLQITMKLLCLIYSNSFIQFHFTKEFMFSLCLFQSVTLTVELSKSYKISLILGDTDQKLQDNKCSDFFEDFVYHLIRHSFYFGVHNKLISFFRAACFFRTRQIFTL